MQLVADLAGTIGMAFFLKAEIFQLKKILKKKLVTGISKTAYRDKVLAIILTLACFGLTSLWFSFAVIAAEGGVVAMIIYLMKKYRGNHD